MSYRRKNKYHYKEEKRTHIVFNTDPLSLAYATRTDLENEKLLSNVLREAGRLKEERYQAQQREYVLQDLDQICQEWVKSSARKHNHPEEFVSNSKVRLFAFGSYKLDVHSLGDDVDLLCVGPHFLSREMFFDELGQILQSNSLITNFYAVRNAYVPVMSFKYNDIDIDMVYAQLQIELLDMKWDINDDRNLRNLDQTSILSLNGVRLAHKTLELVPNKKVFRLSLRAIRYWAKQRGVYSNKLGYLGGVSWAILTARVCQLYPNANASQIVQNFFLFYHIWNFGTPLKAITLCDIVQHEDMPSIKVWDPNDQTTKYELMHIITPAFPAMNSTHNVSMSTFEVLKREIARAFHLLSRAKRAINEGKWGKLFERNKFFMDHKNYIFIKACAPQKNLTEWSGLIESKIRSLVGSLEHHLDVKVTPFCKAIKLKLTKQDINKHTHPEILKELEIKRKQKMEKQRQKKLALKKKKLEDLRLAKLQKKLRKEREKEEEQKQQQEEQKNKQQQQQQQQMETDNNNNNNTSKQTDATDQNETDQNEATPSTPSTSQGDGDDIMVKTEPETDDNNNNNINKADISTQININDGLSQNSMETEVTEKEKEKEIETEKEKSLPTEENGVLLISNLSLPIETIKESSKSPSLAGSAGSNGINNKKKKSSKKSNSLTPSATTSIVQSKKPSNPYIYVAPELQRKYTFKGRNRRQSFYGNRRNRFSMNSRMTYNRTYTINPSISSTVCNGSPAPSNGSNGGGDKKDDDDTNKTKEDIEKEISVSATTPIVTTATMIQSPQIPQNSHAFVVGKNQIACCQSFNNKVLQDKAEKYGYECRAFVIGLKVINRAIGIETTANGQTVDVCTKFDFSRSVVSFLKGLNHIYTDSHIVIELINCHKVPHFLFPENQYKRPNKESIKSHQRENEANHEKWKSKSCVATLAADKKQKLNTTATMAANESNTNNNTPILNGSASPSKTPKFDKDDMLINDDSVEALPGFGLSPSSTQQNGDGSHVENTSIIHNKTDKDKDKEIDDVDVNMIDESKTNGINVINGMPPLSPTTNRKRKIDEIDDDDDDDNNDNSKDTENVEAPSLKKRKLTTNGNIESNGNYKIVSIINTNEEKPLNNNNNINYSNPYFSKICWDKKYDNSPTYEYAVKLYRKSLTFTSWSAVCHDLTATATHVYNTCNDQSWKIKLKKVLSNHKYGWNGCKYQIQLNKKLMFDLAHDIAYNYIKHKNEKKRKRKF